MTGPNCVLLPDRGVIGVTGPDAEKLLQGVITGDMELLKEDRNALHAGLLTPQGKILFDFFVVRSGDGFFIETGREQVADLLKRLSMYKLRADVGIADESSTYSVVAVWGNDAGSVFARRPDVLQEANPIDRQVLGRESRTMQEAKTGA